MVGCCECSNAPAEFVRNPEFREEAVATRNSKPRPLPKRVGYGNACRQSEVIAKRWWPGEVVIWWELFTLQALRFASVTELYLLPHNLFYTQSQVAKCRSG